jgi:L-aminopeptidase/D-esterase-like protein
MIRCGMRNLITDVDGLAVGNTECPEVRSGVTVILPDERVVAACDVRGGAPGTRDTDALDATCIADAIDAIVLSGGSTYGLEAASGAVAWLGARHRGFRMGKAPRVSPIVPSAVLFDLSNGGDKDWGEMPPYREWGRRACEIAGNDIELGNVGAGMGALVGDLKGGLGSASAVEGELQIGALMAINAFGSAVIPGTRHLWAGPYELGGEFGGHNWPTQRPAVSAIDPLRGCRSESPPIAPGGNTTIGVVATNAVLAPAEAKRIAIMAQDGLSRGIRPIHSHVDGDVIFVISTGRIKVAEGERLTYLLRLGSMAADCVVRAIGRGVWAASDLGGVDSYRTRYDRQDRLENPAGG